MWKRDLSVGKVATFYLVFASFSPPPPPPPPFRCLQGQCWTKFKCFVCVTVDHCCSVILYKTKVFVDIIVLLYSNIE